MKTIVKILMILDFAAVVFLPSVYMTRSLLIPMFAVMAGLVVLYWFAMFWVGRKDALKVLGKTPDFDIFAGKVPTDPSADLTRGRLCIEDGRIVLLQRTDGKERKTAPCKEVWSMQTNEITSLGFGKVLPARKGLILYMGDDEIQFTCSGISKRKDGLYKALGWNMGTAESTKTDAVEANE